MSALRWHLAHTTWFFETFVLGRSPDYTPFDERYGTCLTRTTTPLATSSRAAGTRYDVTARIARYHGRTAITSTTHGATTHARRLDQLSSGTAIPQAGLEHGQQHQELILTDIKHMLSCNPILPAYDARPFAELTRSIRCWKQHAGGTFEFGHAH